MQPEGLLIKCHRAGHNTPGRPVLTWVISSSAT
jgi:hypothetical protein